jgi:hypothetical protein
MHGECTLSQEGREDLAISQLRFTSFIGRIYWHGRRSDGEKREDMEYVGWDDGPRRGYFHHQLKC